MRLKLASGDNLPVTSQWPKTPRQPEKASFWLSSLSSLNPPLILARILFIAQVLPAIDSAIDRPSSTDCPTASTASQTFLLIFLSPVSSSPQARISFVISPFRSQLHDRKSTHPDPRRPSPHSQPPRCLTICGMFFLLHFWLLGLSFAEPAFVKLSWLPTLASIALAAAWTVRDSFVAVNIMTDLALLLSSPVYAVSSSLQFSRDPPPPTHSCALPYP